MRCALPIPETREARGIRITVPVSPVSRCESTAPSGRGVRADRGSGPAVRPKRAWSHGGLRTHAATNSALTQFCGEAPLFVARMFVARTGWAAGTRCPGRITLTRSCVPHHCASTLGARPACPRCIHMAEDSRAYRGVVPLRNSLMTGFGTGSQSCVREERPTDISQRCGVDRMKLGYARMRPGTH